MAISNTKPGMRGTTVKEHTAVHAHEYTSFGTQLDLWSDSNGAGDDYQDLPRAVMVTDKTAGANLELVRVDGTTEVFDCTNLVGVLLPVAFRSIGTNTTVSKLIVFW